MDQERPACQHEDFIANVEVNRFQRDGANDPSIIAYNAEITVRCAECDEPMVFYGEGIRVGLMPDRPCISVSGTELRAPLRPQSADPHFGLGMPGFHARIIEGESSTAN